MEKVLEALREAGANKISVEQLGDDSIIELRGRLGSVSTVKGTEDTPIKALKELVDQLMTFDPEETFVLLQDEDSEADLEVLDKDSKRFKKIGERLMKNLGVSWNEDEPAVDF